MKTIASVFTLVLLIVTCFDCKSQSLSYSETITLIEQYTKMKEHTPETSGPLLHEILQAMIDNYAYVVYTQQIVIHHKLELREYYQRSTEGLKMRLVRNLSKRKVDRMALAATDPREGKLLRLLYQTRQSPVRVFITDDRLDSLFGSRGGRIKAVERHFWKRIDQNLIDVLEEYPPETTEILTYIIAQPFFSGIRRPEKNYESAWSSWASDSLRHVYFSCRKVELARRSVPVRLLASNGLADVPAVVGAQFIWSGWNTRWMWLDFPWFGPDDISELNHLTNNVYYGELAKKMIVNVTPRQH